MDAKKGLELLKGLLSEIVGQSGAVRLERFSSLREVEVKIREARIILGGLSDLPAELLKAMDQDLDFQVNSRRVRLEALAGYIRNAIKFSDTGAFEKPKKIIHSPPSFSRLTAQMPGLTEELEKRWREAQKCVHVGAYTSAVIVMGSILEGLLLARAHMNSSAVYQASRAPRDKAGKPLAIPSWSLSSLIDVAAELGWIKTDRAKFSHALRESRNVVHPWQAVSIKADFDAATCLTSWNVLDASVDDLIASIS